MKYKTELSRRSYKAGYIIVRGIVDGADFGCEDFEMSHAETPSGDYIGDSKTAYRLCKEMGIKPQLRADQSRVCSIGFCENEQKWYGWSHRAICGFGVGDIAKEGDCTTTSGCVDGYFDEFPDAIDYRVPVGFEAKTLDDAKRMSIAFADIVS